MFIAEKVISLTAPHSCMVCGAEGSLVCAWCLPEFVPPLPARCYRCYRASPMSAVCRNCRRRSRLKHVWVRTSYEQRAKQLIHDFKFARRQAAAQPLARLMTECLPYLTPETIITYVPTATRRVRMRGYDHAELLARCLAKELGLPCASLLVRSGQARQVGAKRSQRLVQLERAFQVAKSARIRGSSVLLVDDLVTTGASLETAAACLKTAGAQTVHAAVFAQKQ